MIKAPPCYPFEIVFLYEIVIAFLGIVTLGKPASEIDAVLISFKSFHISPEVFYRLLKLKIPLIFLGEDVTYVSVEGQFDFLVYVVDFLSFGRYDGDNILAFNT